LYELVYTLSQVQVRATVRLGVFLTHRLSLVASVAVAA
jgi:hypothetical protein